jgi:hypothetical protein
MFSAWPCAIPVFATILDIAGAVIGKYWKQTQLATWIGGLLGAIPGIILRMGIYILLFRLSGE